MSDEGQNDVYYALESVWGETPDQTSTLKQLPLRGADINGDFGWAEDDELKGGLYTTDPKVIAKRAAGTTRHWLRPQNYLDLLVAAIKAPTPTPASGGVSTFDNGTTRHSFLIERYFSADAIRQHYTGSMINRLALSVNAQNLVEMDIDWMCKDENVGFGGTDSASAGDGSPTAYADTARYDAGPNLGTLNEGGSSSGELIRQFTMSIEAKLRERPIVKQYESGAFGMGDTIITGTLQAYFADATLMKKWLGNTTTSLAFKFETAQGDIEIQLPNVTLRSKTADAGSRNADQMINFNWSAHYDSATSRLIRIIETDPS